MILIMQEYVKFARSRNEFCFGNFALVKNLPTPNVQKKMCNLVIKRTLEPVWCFGQINAG